PGLEHRAIVVAPALDPCRRAFRHHAEAPRRELVGHHPLVEGRENRAHGMEQPVRPGREELRLALPDRRLLLLGRALERHLDLLDVELAHSVEEVESLCAVRRDGGERRSRDTAAGEKRRAGEGMRAAAGVAPRREPVGSEGVEHVGYVGCDVTHRAAEVRVGTAVAGAVEADQADPLRARVLDVVRVEPATRGRAVVEDDREALRIAVVVDVERPPVRQRDVELAHSPGFSGVPGLPSGKISASRRATGAGTSSETSPPNAAISFTPLEETKLTCGLAMT